MSALIDPRLLSLLLSYGLPVAATLLRDVFVPLFHSLTRSDVDPPWALHVAMWVVKDVAAAHPDWPDAEHERYARDAIEQYLRSQGGRPSAVDVAKLYELAAQRIRHDLALEALQTISPASESPAP